MPYGDISISPSSAVLNYGQGVFEGMRAYRTAKDRIVVFRPDENAARIAIGANRMCLEEVPKVRASPAPRPLTRSSNRTIWKVVSDL